MSSKKHLLVIRLSAMGDVAMTVPVIHALVTQYPEVEVTVLTRGFFKPIFSGIPNVQVFAADVKGKHKGILGLRKLYKELHKLEIDVVADLHHVLRSNILKIYFKLGGYKFVQLDKGRAEKKAITATKNKVFKPLKTTYQRYADVFAHLGFSIASLKPDPLPKYILSNNIKAIISSGDKKVIGIAPFAAFAGKTYPLDLMEQVVAQLNKTNTYQILLFGGGNKEKEQFETWEEQYSNTVNIVGKITFSEELALISNLDAMLAMDSGNAHLAALYGVHTITLWGVTHPYTGFYPFGQPLENALLADRKQFPLIPTSVYGNKMPEAYEEVMRTISPNDIIKTIERVLSKVQKTT